MATPLKSFKLPKSFVTQLNEFTKGHLLITVNEAGEFEVFFQADSPAIQLGLTRFASQLISRLDMALDDVLSASSAEPDSSSSGPVGDDAAGFPEGQ